MLTSTITYSGVATFAWIRGSNIEANQRQWQCIRGEIHITDTKGAYRCKFEGGKEGSCDIGVCHIILSTAFLTGTVTSGENIETLSTFSSIKHAELSLINCQGIPVDPLHNIS